MIEALQHDTNLWVLLSFLVFLGVVLKFGWSAIIKTLDDKIESIKKEVETAEALRVEAQEMRAQYQRKQRDTEQEIQDFLKAAETRAQKLKEKMETEFQNSLERKQRQHEERIAQMKTDAINSIKNYTASLTISATQEVIEKTMTAETEKEIYNTSLKSLPRALN